MSYHPDCIAPFSQMREIAAHPTDRGLEPKLDLRNKLGAEEPVSKKIQEMSKNPNPPILFSIEGDELRPTASIWA